MTETVSVDQLRRFIVAHQRFATRPRNAGAEEVVAVVQRLSCIQLDSISRVDRAHRLTLASRIGRYSPGVVSELLAQGQLFEYWAHEACLLPMEDYPLFKRRMEHLRHHHWWGREHHHDPKIKARVLGALREQGPLPSRFFEGAGGGGMWNWKPAKQILEDLFAAGEIAVAGREGFQRLYALAGAVIPPEVHRAPVPSEVEFVERYALRAVQGRGALTESGIAEHCRFRGGLRRLGPVVDSLVSRGQVRRVELDDGGAPVVVLKETQLDVEPPRGSVLLCPFDNLAWDRPFVERVFGFRHLIEVYKPQPQRQYGYYVFPFLYGDRLVGRADLRARRAEGTLVVDALHLETGIRRSSALEEAFDGALRRLARAVDLPQVEHGETG